MGSPRFLPRPGFRTGLVPNGRRKKRKIPKTSHHIYSEIVYFTEHSQSTSRKFAELSEGSKSSEVPRPIKSAFLGHSPKLSLLLAHVIRSGTQRSGLLPMISDERGSTASMILCCTCGVPIESNAMNMCMKCIQSSYDITEGLGKQVSLQSCRRCGR